MASILPLTVDPAGAADPGDEFWLPAYSPAGVQGDVQAMVSRPGALYIGGRFDAVSDVPARYVAMLTTSSAPNVTVTAVSPLGDGLDGYVTDLCEHGGDIVAVGQFVKSGYETLEHVARWDGAAWHGFAGGLPGSLPRAAVSYEGALHVGTWRWTGTAWEDLFQTNGTITSFAVHDGLLYVGGSFTEIQGQPASYLFAWDGTQVLTPEPGFPYPVKAMVGKGGGLYVAGSDDYSVSVVHSWDGSSWTVESTGPIVEHLAVYAGDVYATTIILSPDRRHQYVLQTNAGGAWHTVADIWPGAMVEHEGLLLAQADPGDDPVLLTPGLAAFDGAALRDVFVPGEGYSTGFATVAPFGAGLIVGGSFTIADGQRIDGAALKFAGGWFPAGSPADIPSSFPATLETLVSVGTEVFARFMWVDWDIGVEELAKLVWDVDRYRWQVLDKPGWSVGVLQTVGAQLFNISDGWLRLIDPQTGSFTDLSPFAANGGIYDTCEALGSLTICGSFTTINGQPAGNVARYVAGSWEGVGNPLPGLRVQAVAGMDGSRLAAATWVDGVFRVWVFDGAAWSVLPGDFNHRVDHLVYHRDRLFAAGTFDRIGPVRAAGVAVWTGDNWAPVGSGLGGGTYDRVTAVLSQGDRLCFAGRFDRAGGHASAGFAEWRGDPTLITGDPSAVPDESVTRGRLLEAARPNPFNPRTEIAFVVPEPGAVRIGIYDLKGRLVRNLVDECLDAARHARTWDGRDDAGRLLPSGVYFARMTTSGRADAVGMMLVR